MDHEYKMKVYIGMFKGEVLKFRVLSIPSEEEFNFLSLLDRD